MDIFTHDDDDENIFSQEELTHNSHERNFQLLITKNNEKDNAFAEPEVDFSQAVQFHQTQRVPLANYNYNRQAFEEDHPNLEELPECPVEKELENLKMILKSARIEGRREFFYKLDYAFHVELIEKLNKEFTQFSKIDKMKNLLIETLRIDQFWKIFMRPTQIQGDDVLETSGDSIFRAFLLSRPFQIHMFQLLMEKLDMLSGLMTEEQIDQTEKEEAKFLAYLLIEQLKASTSEIYDSNGIKDLIFDKEFENWRTEMSAKFIDALPEWLLDNTIHNEVLSSLAHKFIQMTCQQTEARQAILRVMKVLDGSYTTTVEIRRQLLRMIMRIEPELVPEVIDYILKSIRPEEKYGFFNFLVWLRKYLDFGRLKEKNRSQKIKTAHDEMLTKIFWNIISYAKNHTHRVIADFKKSLVSSQEKVEKFDPAANGSTASSDAEEDPEFVPDTDLDGLERNKKRNLIMFDLMFMFVIQSVKRDSNLVIDPLRAQLAKSSIKASLELFIVEAISYQKFATTFYRQIIKCAEDLIQVNHSGLSSLGGHILQQLLIEMKSKREDALNVLKNHMGQIEHETTTCLNVLERLVENQVTRNLLIPHMDQLMAMFL